MAVAAGIQDAKNSIPGAEKIRKIDFKMVSFTLAGKDYGIDIMKVKEIRKAGNFTYVPNTPVFVRGVDNLRGDIIPIIDLRIMFNLPAEQKSGQELENIIILRMDELIMGIIVDNIEKVIGISKETIQPPHPIFGDINVKYISGVVEHESKLYIILDVERIFHQKDEGTPKTAAPASKLATASAPESPGPESVASLVEAPVNRKAPEPVRPDNVYSQETSFLMETLATFLQFHTTPVNQNWVRQRAQQWIQQKNSEKVDYQLSSSEDATAFLQPFFSPFTGQFWPSDALEALAPLVDADNSKTLTIWNPGCGKGVESYSLAVLLETAFPGKAYKIWASDSDLLNISMAPTLVFPEGQIEDVYRAQMIPARNGLVFKPEVKNRVLFEYHDITNLNPFTQLDMIVCRDVVSFLKPEQQSKIFEDFDEKLKKGGLLVLGTHEVALDAETWEKVNLPEWSVYKKR